MISICTTHLRHVALFLPLLCVFLSSALIADTELIPPWESTETVGSALAAQDGEAVVCRGATVSKIAGRNNPAYFVISDSWNSNARLVVLSRPPLSLRNGQTVDAEGTMGTLPNGERYIGSPNVHGYFDIGGTPLTLPPFGGAPSDSSKQALLAPAGAIPPSDPSVPDDGTGIPAEVTAGSDSLEGFASLASLVSTAPPVLTRVELTSLRIADVGDGYIVVGDDTGTGTAKVYTNATPKITDRVLGLAGTVHTENGQMVIYADSGPAPFFDEQADPGMVSTASPGTSAYGRGTLFGFRQSKN